MESCHNCSEIIEKLNKEYEVLFNEKELYKNKCNEKNDLIINMIKKEYAKIDEIRKLREKVTGSVGNYNVYCGELMECKHFIIDLFKLLK